eukprot:gene19109-22847_t
MADEMKGQMADEIKGQMADPSHLLPTGADLEDITEDPSADHFEEHAEHLAGRRVLEGEEEAADGTQYANYKKRIAELEKQLQQQTEACRNASH